MSSYDVVSVMYLTLISDMSGDISGSLSELYEKEAQAGAATSVRAPPMRAPAGVAPPPPAAAAAVRPGTSAGRPADAATLAVRPGTSAGRPAPAAAVGPPQPGAQRPAAAAAARVAVDESDTSVDDAEDSTAALHRMLAGNDPISSLKAAREERSPGKPPPSPPPPPREEDDDADDDTAGLGT